MYVDCRVRTKKIVFQFSLTGKSFGRQSQISFFGLAESLLGKTHTVQKLWSSGRKTGNIGKTRIGMLQLLTDGKEIVAIYVVKPRCGPPTINRTHSFHPLRTNSINEFHR